MSYHDLFSVDSGLMEFVEWKEHDDEIMFHSLLSIKDASLDKPYRIE